MFLLSVDTKLVTMTEKYQVSENEITRAESMLTDE